MKSTVRWFTKTDRLAPNMARAAAVSITRGNAAAGAGRWCCVSVMETSLGLISFGKTGRLNDG